MFSNQKATNITTYQSIDYVRGENIESDSISAEPLAQEEANKNGNCVLRVVGELDGLLAALRLLIRTCEKQRFHIQTHALAFSYEIILRRRNYILNVSSSNSDSPPYERYPCENCHITYPTSFLMSWLEYLLHETASFDQSKTISESGIEERGDKEVFEVIHHSLCNQSCLILFGASSSSVNGIHRMVEGVLYPMGAPFVAGPIAGPPTTYSTSLLGEFDELKLVLDTLRLVLKTLQSNNTRGNKSDSSADICLVESVFNLVEARSYFGFDMDCVNDVKVDICRSHLFDVLETYESRVLVETFDQEIG